MLEEDEQIQDSDIAIRQKSAQLDSIRVEEDDELSDSPFKHVERRETIKERRKREGPRKKKLSKHIDFIDDTYEGLKNPIEAARRWLRK